MINNTKCGYFAPITKIGKLTIFDKINLFFIVIFGLIYILLTSNYVDNINITIINNNLNLKISFIGLLLSLFLSSFITGYIFREYDFDIRLLLAISVISFIAILSYYTSTYYKNNTIDFSHYSHYLFPLLGTLFLVIHYTWIKLKDYSS